MKASETLEQIIPGQVFKGEVLSWAKRIGVEPKEIRLRLMKSKWASCSSSGRLTFNAEILQQPATFRSEAIVHELLHLKVPNHGKLFRNLIKALLAERPAPQS
ncbi:MAG: M48 family metallopeptidase [Chloroflexota bacterium]